VPAILKIRLMIGCSAILGLGLRICSGLIAQNLNKFLLVLLVALLLLIRCVVLSLYYLLGMVEIKILI